MTAAADPASASGAEAGRRSLIGNARSLLVGRLFSAFSMWLALIVLAKLADPATVGIYALAQALCIPAAEIGKTGLREIYASDTRGTYRFGDYLGLRLLAVGVAFLAMLAAGLSLAQSALVAGVVALYALARSLEMVSDMLHGLFQSHERMEHIGRSLCLQGPLSLALLASGYWLTGSLPVAVCGYMLAFAVVLALHDLPVGLRLGRGALRPSLSPTALRGIGAQALPLTVATALAMVAVYLPRLAVERTLDLASLGVFAALMALAMAPNRFVTSLGVAVSVRLARHHRAGECRAFGRVLGTLALIVALGGGAATLLAAAFGDAIVSAIYTAEYGSHGDLLVWLVAAATLRCLADVLKFGMIASRRFWALTAQYAVVAATAALACATLIPPLGLTGAGIAVFVTFLVHLGAVGLGLAFNLPRTGQPELHP